MTPLSSTLRNVSCSLFSSSLCRREDESISLLSPLDAFLKEEPLDDMWSVFLLLTNCCFLHWLHCNLNFFFFFFFFGTCDHGSS